MPFLCLRVVRVAAAFLSILCVLAGSAAWAARIELVSHALPELTSDTAAAGSSLAVGQQVRPMVSFDGRWTVFVSAAPNLVPGQVDFNSGDDVFLYDRVANTVTLVSHTSTAAATAGDRVSGNPSISSDGRWIAFFSHAGNLIAGQVESNAGEDVFLYDRDTGTNTLVSHTATSNTTTGNNISLDPVVSANGNAVVYVSRAMNLIPGQVDTTSTSEDIFFWDRATNTTTLVSHIATSVTTTPSSSSSSVPVINADGSWIAYTSGASNLVAGATDTNGRLDVYLWNRPSNTNVIVSHSSTASLATGNGSASSARISADGAFVLFRSDGTNYVFGQNDFNGGSDLFLYNSSLGTITLVSRSSSSATTTGSVSTTLDGVLSADGNWVAFAGRATDYVSGSDSNTTDDVFLWSRATGGMSLVTRRAGTTTTAASTPGSGGASAISISANGSIVGCLTRATDLVSGQTDTNGATDLFVFDRTTGTNVLASGTAGSAAATANSASTTLSASGDGQWIGYATSATNILSGLIDANGGDDVLLFGLGSLTNVLASRRDPAMPLATASGDSTVVSNNAANPVPSAVVSADGRWLVFQSSASQLISGQVDTNATNDVFLYDRSTGTTTLISRAVGTTLTAGNGESRLPVISADGRWVAFTTRATNLVTPVTDFNAADDIYLWDRVTGAMALVSHNASGLSVAGSGNKPVLSSDASAVLFMSTAPDIVPGQSDNSSTTDLFSYDRATGTITLVSHSRFSTTSAQAIGSTTDAAMSADGRFVAFDSSGTSFIPSQNDLTGPDLFLWDRTTDSFMLVTHSSVLATNTAGYFGHYTMSADGNWIAFSSSGTNLVAGVSDTNSQPDLFLWERATNTNRLVSRSATSATVTANNATQGAMLSADGSRLVFLSRATNLVNGGSDTNSGNDTFVYERATGQVRLASHIPTSTVNAGNSTSRVVAISADGSRISFQNAASTLVAGDTFGSFDVFLYDPVTTVVSLASYRNGATTGLLENCEGGYLSADGKVVPFSTLDRTVVANDFNSRQDVFLWMDETPTDLAIAKTDGVSSAVPGQVVTYMITATNSGPTPTGATVTDSFPAALQGVTWTCAAGGGASCPASGAGSLSQAVNLPVNGTVTFAVTGTVAADATGSLINTASIAPTGGVTDSNPANNSSTDTDTLTPQADLSVAMTDAPDPVGRGAILTYLISVTNAGPSAAASVSVTDTLPAGVSFVGASGAGWSCAPAGGGVTCTRPSLAPGSAPALTVQVTAPVARGFVTLTNAVVVTASTADPVAANNGAVVETSVIQPGITVAPVSGLATTEAGGTATFSVVLDTAPLADVMISLASSDTAEGTVSPAALTFTTSDWSTPRTVTVTGVNDDYDDGSVAYTIAVGAASSADAGYAGIDPADVAVTNEDDDTAGFTVSPISGPTTEAGGTATFTVALTARPTADVTVGLTSSDTAEGTVEPASLTFTTDTWNTPQTVTVTGVDDDYDDADVAYTVALGAAVSPDASYAGIDPPDVAVTNEDDDTAGFTVSPISGPTTEASGTATFTVVLTARPRADVTVALTSSDTAEGTVAPASLTFTTDTWSTPQTVTVTGVNDDYDDGDAAFTITTGAAISTDSVWAGIDPADVAVTNQDDDTAGFTVSPISGPTTEAGGTATFTVVLTARPRADVTVGLASSDTAEGTVEPASLTFTTDTWNAPQAVTVTGVDDNYDDGDAAFIITTGAAVSTDAVWAGIDPADVAVTNQDDDTLGFTVSPISGPTTEAGGTATFTMVLTARPRADVTVGLTSSDTGEGTVAPASLTFTTDTWSVPQTVTVTGVDDEYDDGDAAFTITTGAAVSTDAVWAGLDPADVAVTNQDDDTAGFEVSPTSGLVTTEAGGTATFTVTLTARPQANVTIALTSDEAEGTVEPASLTFTPDDWSTQTVTVTGVDDDYDDGDVDYTISTGAAESTDAAWAGLDPADVDATNQDDDAATIAVSPTSGLVTTEAGGTATFTVSLAARPTADVTIALSSSDAGEGQPSPATLTFTTDDWATPQTVTVTGQDDDVRDGDIAYTITVHPAQSSDPAFAGIDPADVAAVNQDNNYEGVYYAITPCRLVDTRQPGYGPPLANNQVAIVTVHGACGIPPTARAVAMNLTFSGAGQRGTVLVYPGDLDRPPVPEYLWIRAGAFSRSLSTLMKLGADGTLAIMPKLQAPQLNPTVHIVLDVTGYFE